MADLEGLVHGNADAFENIYRRHRDRVYGFAFRMLNSQPLAEEVAHDAFMVLIEHPRRYRTEQGSMLTFLCSIARNQIMNHFRHRGHGPESSLDGDEVNLKVDEDILRGDPLTNLLDAELAAEIGRAVESLPVLLREAIVLREFQELSYEEIADVAGVSLSTIKVRLHRARRALTRALEPYIDQERTLLS
jgi:RNA polymerase sigma-70 factor (ECF subfamily)